MIRLILSVLLAISCTVSAQSEPSNEAQFVTTNEWHFGVAAGVGVATNPLNGGDNFPLVLIPDLHYYGEQVFFDNGRLGYTLAQTPELAVSVITEINPENRFFVFWHPSNIFMRSNAFADIQISIDQVEKRRWALDGGLDISYFHDNFWFNVAWLHDISQVYKGSRAKASLSYMLEMGDAQLTSEAGVWYFSSQLADYYYGIQEHDNWPRYQLDAAYLPYVKLQFTKPIDNTTQWLASLNYQSYQQLADSPLFAQDYALSIFVGVKYAF